MGLTVAVGLFAQNLAEIDEDERPYLEEPFRMLNEVLCEHGLPLHEEPTSISHEDYFEAGMWGYTGIHALRRLAAYVALENRLPPAPVDDEWYSRDPVLARFQTAHDEYMFRRDKGVLGFLGSKPPRQPFQHLLYHSDAEGFYLPRDFDDVLIDFTEPQRPGLGAMIGSSVQLLHECKILARRLELPDDFDPEGEDFLEIMEVRPESGPPWQMHCVAAHTLANLAAASEASIKLGAVIQFT